MHPTHFEALYPVTSREKELEQVAQFLKEGNSCQLVGMPGVGGSTIVGLLAYNRAIREKHFGHLSKWFHFVLVNFSEVRNKPLFEVTKLMFLELADSLRERNMLEEYEEVSNTFKDALAFQDELVLFQSLKKATDYLSIEKELTIIFLFERFDTYINMLTSDFFNNLRVLRNRAKYRFSVVFSLNRPLEDLIEPTLMADYYEFLAGHTVYIELEDQLGLAFRLEYMQKLHNKTFDKDHVEKIISFTAGHGKLTKVCLEKCLQANLRAEEVEKTFFLQIPTVQGVLFEIWNFLSPDEQQALMNHETLPFLENIHLTHQGIITIPLFADFVQELAQKQEHEPLVYDDATNTIKKGLQTISDNLTGAEFRLLRLLITNKERVVEREEIIAVVWQNSASTAGVTEQAIDQLVFRLRKKIEPDPSNPTLLQTIKGRGLKLQTV